MIKYVCDRCGKEISEEERGFGILIRTPEVDNEFGECDYCESCMEEIREFIRCKLKKNVIKKAKNVIKGSEDVLKGVETVEKELVARAEDEQQTRKRNKVDVPKIFSLKNAGWSVEQIAEEMRISKQSVYHHLQKHKDELANNHLDAAAE